MWFMYHQNNSGGAFYGPHFVIVEANSAREADARAEEHGVYFDGVDSGADCDCCGDRWCRAYSYEGEQEPQIYGMYVHKYLEGNQGDTALVVPKSGPTCALPAKDK